jgi:hypothetical protein
MLSGDEHMLSGDEQIDGRGTVACDEQGKVYVFWHAVKRYQSEAFGRVYMAVSADGGERFSRKKAIDTPGSGTCGCCGMQAAFINNRLFVLYRDAVRGTARDTTLLVGDGKAENFTSLKLQGWTTNACPMTLFSLASCGSDAVGAWETKGRIFYAKLSAAPGGIAPLPAGDGTEEKYPSLAAGTDGRFLLTWTDGAGWGRGGAAEYELLSKDLKPVQTDRLGLTPAWSFSTAVALPDGRFAIIY